MTRREFEEEYNYNDKYISDLFEFAAENDIEYFYDICDADSACERIDEAVRECIREYSWTTLRDYLDDIPEGYEWYHFDGWFPSDGFDENYESFDRLRNIIIDNMEGVWDEEPEEEETIEEETPAPVETHEEEIKEEDMFDMNALDGLYSACSGIMQIITVAPQPQPQTVAVEQEIVLCDDDLLF